MLYMEVYYCDVLEIKSILGSLKLDDSSFSDVFQFMNSSLDNQGKDIIRMYLLSLLENHLHIDHLRFSFEVIHGYELGCSDETFEVIDDQPNKPFWNWIANEDLSFIEQRESTIMSWIYDNFDSYFQSFYSLDRDECLDEDILSFRKREKDELLLSLSEALAGTNISIEQFDKSIELAMKKVKDYHNIDEESSIFVCYVRMYVEEFILKDEYIIKLARDLIVNLTVLKNLCESCLSKETDLGTILRNIRLFLRESVKQAKYISSDSGMDDYSIMYRDFKFFNQGGFWDKITPPEDIFMDMEKLFSEFLMVQKIEDDTEYAVKCFELCQRLLQIHPYRNGNGRTSKYLLFLLLISRGILPVSVTDNRGLTSCYQKNFGSSDYFLGRMHIVGRRVGSR